MKFMDVQAAGGTLKLAKIARGADYFGVRIPEERAFSLMDRYLELGGNVIDTARIYGARRPATRPIPTASRSSGGGSNHAGRATGWCSSPRARTM